MRYFIATVLVFYLNTVQAKSQRVIDITVLDVAEGQAVVLSYGHEAVLIDTGHAGQVERVLTYMARKDIHQLKYLILTHLHPDHASGFFRIREAFPQTPVLYNCHSLAEDVTPDMVRWVNEALQKDAFRQCVQAGDRIEFYLTGIKILWPQEITGSNLNHNSIVIHIDEPGRDVLIMGDTDTQAEQLLLSRNHLPQNIDVLVVGHHGASDATSEAFISHVKPEMAVISVNRNNIRGYPADEVIDRLERHGIKVLRTDKEGDIEL